MPDKEGWESLLAGSGITNDTTVVVYGAPSKYYATYAIWLLTIFGHQDVRLMNGGVEKWTAENRPVTTDVPAVTSTAYQAQEPDWTIRALRDLVHESIDDSSRILVDVRDQDEYCGALNPTWKLPEDGGQRWGRIPSAVNITWNMVLLDDGTFKPDNTINRAEFTKVVITAKFSSDYIATTVGRNCFIDVSTQWFAPYVCLAKIEGILSGYSDGSFKSAQSISFVEAAKILAELYGLEITHGDAWYEGYVKALQDDGFIPPTIGQLDKPITRAEMAELIWRIKEQRKDQASATLIQGPIVMDSGDYAGWTKYPAEGFSFYHPNWYIGEKWGRTVLTEELDYYQNLQTPYYMAVDT